MLSHNTHPIISNDTLRNIIVVIIIIIALISCSYMIPMLLCCLTQNSSSSVTTSKPVTRGGFSGKPQNVENVLLVDVANMYVGWYMEKYEDRMPYGNQRDLVNLYVECMKDHFKRFSTHNDTDTSAVVYVIKNHKFTLSKKMVAPPIGDRTWKEIKEFVRINKNAHIAVAEDYSLHKYNTWKNKKMHYLRGRDDYLCFRLAQQYKKKYVNTVVMSDDKFKDFVQFGYVPPFTATYVHKKWSGNGEVVQSSEKIIPKPNILGQLRDYKMVKITTVFSFKDPKFLKTSAYKIPEPGKIWNF